MDSHISQSQADSTDNLEGLPPNATEKLAPNLGSISRSGGKKYRTGTCKREDKGIVENWERSGSEVSLGGVNSGVCVSDALDLLTGTLRPRLPFLRNNSLRMWS